MNSPSTLSPRAHAPHLSAFGMRAPSTRSASMRRVSLPYAREPEAPMQDAPRLDATDDTLLADSEGSESGAASVCAVAWSESDTPDDSARAWWRYAQSFPLLSAQQEVALAKRIEAGDEAAFNQMVESNLRLVANIARKCRRFSGNSLHLCDLIQEGSIGLMRAVRKFDYRKGYKFSTYACYWIRQAVMRSIAERGRSIRLPVHVVESVSRAERARTVLTHELQRAPKLREMANYLQLPERKVGEMLERGTEPMSLEVVMGDADESILVDFIEDEHACSPEANAAHVALQNEIRNALSSLSEREAQVISLRFGLDGGNSGRTLDEVGAAMQLTRERIRQIEKSAMKQLRACHALQEIARLGGTFSRSGHTNALA